MFAAGWVILVGFGILVFVAIAIGRIDGESQDAAWRKIAAARREIVKDQRRLEEERQILWGEINQARVSDPPIVARSAPPQKGLTSV